MASNERPPAPAPLLLHEQEDVIQERLVVPERPLKNLMSKLNVIAKSRSNEERSRAVTSFTLELEAFVLNLARVEAVARQTTANEVAWYETEVGRIEGEKTSTEEAIHALKRELVDVRQERQNKLAYDELAHEIMKYGTREELEHSLTSLHEAISSLENESNKYTEVMNSSEARFEGIASQLEALRADVGHEVGERERRAVERGGEGGGEDDGAAAEADGEEREEEQQRKSLNPSAPSFKPLRSIGADVGLGDARSSRASTPGGRPSRTGKRTRTGLTHGVGEEDTRRGKKAHHLEEEGEMSDVEDEEEEGAA